MPSASYCNLPFLSIVYHTVRARLGSRLFGDKECALCALVGTPVLNVKRLCNAKEKQKTQYPCKITCNTRVKTQPTTLHGSQGVILAIFASLHIANLLAPYLAVFSTKRRYM